MISRQITKELTPMLDLKGIRENDCMAKDCRQCKECLDEKIKFNNYTLKEIRKVSNKGWSTEPQTALALLDRIDKLTEIIDAAELMEKDIRYRYLSGQSILAAQKFTKLLQEAKEVTTHETP